MAIQEELSKQESLLNQLHEELAGKADPEKEEQIWEVQRVCTQLKRKVILIDFSLTVRRQLQYSYLGVVQLFHLLRKGNQVLFIIW